MNLKYVSFQVIYSKKILYLICIITISISFPNEIISQSIDNQKKITLGVKDSLYSKVLDEQREIWVHVPKNSISTVPYGETTYPVVYLLDGDAHFYSVTGMIKQLSTVNGNQICPEMIVVGIPNTNRTRDLSPTKIKNRKDSGGGEVFTSFIKDELIPYIENKYPTKPYRTFIGHSLGGLTVVNTLIHHQELFNNYIAIDPSLWWDDQKILKQAIKALEIKDFKDRSLYFAIANLRKKDMDTVQILKDKKTKTENARSIFKFKNTILTNSQNKLNFAWKFYKNEDHGSVPLIAEYDALHFLFPWYKFEGFETFFTPELVDTVKANDLINFVNAHYERVSMHFGSTILPPEPLINRFGYGFMGSISNTKNSAIAKAFFKLNIKNYPKSSNVYDSMGDFYELHSENAKAIKMFTKAHEIGKSPFTKRKLEKLKNKKNGQ